MSEPRECRCCRIPIPEGRLACPEHWQILPAPLKLAIVFAHKNRFWKTYADNIRAADAIWQERGLWKPGIHKS